MGDYWENKYRCMIRWKIRVDSLMANQTINDDDVIDYLSAFFLECYHLGDWLFECKIATKEDINDFRNKDEFLSICRGLADANKHFKLNRPHKNEYYRFGSATHKGSSTGFSGPSPPYSFSVAPDEYIVDVDGKTYSLFDLLVKCIVSWNIFLEKHGLNLPPISGVLIPNLPAPKSIEPL